MISTAIHRPAEDLISEDPTKFCIVVIGGNALTRKIYCSASFLPWPCKKSIQLMISSAGTGGKVSQECLEEAFRPFGDFVSFSLHKHRVAFVEWRTESESAAAQKALNKR